MKRYRKNPARAFAFTIMEVMVSLGASAAIIGALLLSSMSLHQSLHSSQVYSDAYSDQRRATDYIGRDLRRAVALAVTDSSGVRAEVSGTAAEVLIGDRATLIITIPAYYLSDERQQADYGTALDVVADAQRLDYGSAGGLAPPVEVSYRKAFYGKENCVCLVRREAGVDEIIVRRADSLFVQVGIEAGAQAVGITTWFRSTELGPKPLVTTHDRLLLRNPPLTYRP